MIVLDGHSGTVTSLAYSPDGLTLASGGTDGHVKLWDAASGRERLTCVPLRVGAVVTSLSFSGDGRMIAGGFRGYAVVWSAASGRMLHWHRRSSEQTYHPDPVLVAFHPSEERLALAQGRQALVEVDPRGDHQFASFAYPEQQSWSVPYSPWCCLSYSGGCLAGGCTDHVFVWRPGPLTLHWPNGIFVALAADATGRWLAGARGRGVALWDLTRPAPEMRRVRTFKAGDQVNAVALTPDGRTLLAGGDDWTVHVWDAATGQKRTDFNWRIGQVVALAMSPDGMTAAVTGRKGPQVLIWDLE